MTIIVDGLFFGIDSLIKKIYKVRGMEILELK